MSDIRTIARALGGQVSGHNQISIPGPGHSRNDRSLSVRLVGDDVIVHSYAGDPWDVCKDHVLALLGRSGRPLLQRRAPIVRDDGDRSARPRRLWAEAMDPRGTAAERYLASRKLSIETCRDVRFHPNCPWPGAAWHPVLLAAFRSLETDEITAVHRIRVDQPDLWPKTQRAMLGPVKLAAVKLMPITGSLAIAEGVETAMAANVLGHGPAWALGSAGAIKILPVMPGIERLILLAENNDASRAATAACAQRWIRAGRKVTRIWPEAGCDDLNDELMAKGISNGS
jgi:hypothetical protein